MPCPASSFAFSCPCSAYFWNASGSSCGTWQLMFPTPTVSGIFKFGGLGIVIVGFCILLMLLGRSWLMMEGFSSGLELPGISFSNMDFVLLMAPVRVQLGFCAGVRSLLHAARPEDGADS